MNYRDPSWALLGLTALIASSVAYFAAPEGGIRAARESDGDGNPQIQIAGRAYPRRSIDSEGFLVRPLHPAARIVSQYWSLDEFVYSVAPPEHVVAVSSTAFVPTVSNVYEQAKRYKPALSTDLERVLRRDPDLMMVSHSARADYAAIVRQAGIPIYRAYTIFNSLDQLADTIRVTGYLTGDDAKADAEYARFWTAVNRACARRAMYAGAPHPRVLGVSGRSGYGGGTVFSDVVKRLSGINVAEEGGVAGYGQINSEQLVRWNPQWIVTEADRGKEQKMRESLLADPGIATTDAARNGHILVLDHRVFLPLSPYTANLVTALAEAMYPDKGGAAHE